MARVKHIQCETLPAQLEPGAIYFVRSTGKIVQTDMNGVPVEMAQDYINYMTQHRISLPSGSNTYYWGPSRDISLFYEYLQRYDANLFNPPMDILSYWWGGSYAPMYIPPRSFDIKLESLTVYIKRLYDGWKYTGEVDIDIIGMSANPKDVQGTHRHNFIKSIYEIPAFEVSKNKNAWGRGFWVFDDFDINAIIDKDEFFVWGLRTIQKNFQTSGQIQLFTLNFNFKRL